MAGIVVYKSYMFRNKDPVIDELRTVFKDEGLLNSKGFKAVQGRGAAKAGTYRNWFNGTTRRPQFASIQATAKALGYSYKLTKDKK